MYDTADNSGPKQTNFSKNNSLLYYFPFFLFLIFMHLFAPLKVVGNGTHMYNALRKF